MTICWGNIRGIHSSGSDTFARARRICGRGNEPVDAAMKSGRPKPTNPLGHVFPKPHKDLSFYHPGSEVIRNDINKYKNIPHKDYIPVYVPPYYDIHETGFNNMRHENIFRKYE